MATARYIDLKRMAVHDGPGIRTTLFLKGCSLACIWCHNPEGIRPQPELAIHYAKCVSCGDCAQVCPCHTITKDGRHQLDRTHCLVCGNCVSACVQDALQLYGKPIAATEAARLILEDKLFYGTDGGATVSGGEPLLQAEFCRELFQLLKQEGIHCAIDTCGNVPWESFEKLLPVTDMFLYDIKSIDSALHQQLTGCGNERILDNLKQLDACNVPIEIRMIQVPGLNMAPELLQRTADFLAPLRNITAVRLLPYHAFARSKFAAIGRPDTMPELPSPDTSQLEASALILRQAGLKVILP